MTYETAVALKPHFTIRHGCWELAKLTGDRKRTPTTISHCEGALRPARHTPVLSGDMDATGAAPSCLLRVNLRHSPGVPPTSGAGGEADEIGAKADIGQRMSPVGG